MSSAWSQLEQMLTCAICLDKFKNPRLLPCQHSFCGDACMEGLVDYARRQIKCPECRAEHRIPYQGVQSLPSNVTLIRFLELHSRITGEEPEPVPTFMEKCSVCGEKIDGVQRCAHCEKKVCPECKEAHLDLLRREINRINGQSKRCLSKLQEFKETVSKAGERLTINHKSIKSEIQESCRRLIEDLQRKQTRLCEEVDSYVENEQSTLDKLKVATVDELQILESNIKLADERVANNKFQWNDQELWEMKEIYAKSMEFIRLFDPEIGDFNRKIRFNLIPEFEQMRRRICEVGELKFGESADSLIVSSFQYCNATGQLAMELSQKVAQHQQQLAAQQQQQQQQTSSGGAYGLAPSNSNTNLQHLQASSNTSNYQLELPSSMQNALMRSQSDHRLASQFQQRLKQQQEAAASSKNGSNRYGANSGLDYETESLRSRYAPPRASIGGGSAKDYANELLTRDWPRPSDNDPGSNDVSSFGSSIHFKSAFMRRKEKERHLAASNAGDDDDDLTSEASYGGISNSGGRNVRFYDQQMADQQLSANAAAQPRARLFDCKEVERAPMSGVPRLDECPHLLMRLHQMGAKAIVDKKQAGEDAKRDKDLIDSARLAMTKASERSKLAQRQMSEDEIEKQKRANNRQRDEQQQQSQQTIAAAADEPTTRDSTHLGSGTDTIRRGTTRTQQLQQNNQQEPTGRQSPATTTTATAATESSTVAAPSPVVEPQVTATTVPTPSTPPSPASSIPGGRRSLYGQAVTEKSRRQLSNAIQDAAAYSSLRRSQVTSSVEAGDGDQTPDTSSVASNSSGTRTKRTLRSSGRSLSKQSSVDADGNASPSASASASASTSTTSATTAGGRRRRLARAESSQQSTQQSSIDSSNDLQQQSKNYATGSGGHSDNNNNNNNQSQTSRQQSSLMAEHGAAANRVAGNKASTSSSSSSQYHQSRRPLTTTGGSSSSYSNRFAATTTNDQTSTTTDDDDPAINNNDLVDKEDKKLDSRATTVTPSLSPSLSYRQRQQQQQAKSSDDSDSDDEDDDDDDDDDGDDDDGDDEDGQKTSDGYKSKGRNKGNRRSRELLPNSVNKLLDRSAQIRRDSQEQRSRGDSPQRTYGSATNTTTNERNSSLIRSAGSRDYPSSTATTATTTTTPSQSSYYSSSRPTTTTTNQSQTNNNSSSSSAGFSSATRQRLAYQRSQSFKDDADEPSYSAQSRGTQQGSNNSIYTTASSGAASSAGGRRSSIDEVESPSSSLSGSRRLSGNSGSSDRTLTGIGGSASSRVSAYRRDSSGDNSPSASASSSYAGGYQSRFLSRSRTSAALSSPINRSQDTNPGDTGTNNTLDRHRHHHRDTTTTTSAYDSSGTGSPRSYLSSRDRFMQSAAATATATNDTTPAASGVGGSSSSSLYGTTTSRGSGSSASSAVSAYNPSSHGLGLNRHQPSVSRSSYYNDESPFVDFDDDNDEQYGAYLPSVGFKTHSEYLRNKFGGRRTSSNSSTSSSNLLARSKSSHAAFAADAKHSDDSESDDVDSETGEENTNNKTNNRMRSDYNRDNGTTTTYADRLSDYSQLNSRRRRSSATGRSEGSETGSRGGSFEFSGRSSIYSSKRRLLFKLGSRGSQPGDFTWPRGVAVGYGGQGGREIVVADSSNHRVQVFDSGGKFLNEFGSYGSAEGEFDCLAGVAIDRLNRNYVVSDRYNHRIQVFDMGGKFVRSFGEHGKESGEFNLPWGIACDNSSGLIYVCDKENHRIQVFDGSDGTYVSKFAVCGTQPGQLQHPHYISVGLGKVVVTDTNNHRVQVFDLNGRVLTAFGKEGSSNGQFKFPRGVAMDEQGNVIVGDSGNNRLQIFTSDGSFIKSIGTWGSADGEFKGIEGVAVDSSHNILVCDRENHRIQVF